MDRLNQLRGEPGGSRDSTFDSTAPPSERFLTANESSSKYFSLSEDESPFDISSIKDSTLNPSNSTEGVDPPLISDLSPINKKNDLLDSYRIGKLSEAANILSGGVEIFDDNDNSYDGDELVIDDNVIAEPEEKVCPEVKPKETEPIPSKDTEVVLQIQGKSVEAIDIGNGLYLYRKEGEQEELAAVQVVDPEQQPPNYKFLKVRANAEGNLEVYEEIEVVVPKNVAPDGKHGKSPSHVPIKDINRVISDSSSSNQAAESTKLAPKETVSQISTYTETKTTRAMPKEQVDGFNGKMKFNEARKSPVISTFTPMTFHSTPNKEGIPLTKTMVDMQLQPSRHSDIAKKTIEVNTDICTKIIETTITSEAQPNLVAANAVAEINKVNDSSHNVIKVDKPSPIVTSSEEKKTVESASRDITNSLNVEKESIDPGSLKTKKSEELGIEEVNLKETSSSTVDTKTVRNDNNAESTAESKRETLHIKTNKDGPATAKPDIPSTSKVERKPLETKEVTVTAIDVTCFESKVEVEGSPLENRIFDKNNTINKHVETKSSEKSMELNEIDIKAKVVGDEKKTGSANNQEEKTTIEKLGQSLVDKVEAVAANIPDANLLTHKQGPSLVPFSIIMHKEVMPLSAPNPIEHKKHEFINKYAQEPKPPATVPKVTDARQTAAPENKSDIAPTNSAAEKSKPADMEGIPAIEKALPREEIKDAERTTEDKESSNDQVKSETSQDKNSSNDLIQLHDLDVDLAMQSKARVSLEKALENDISRLDQQLNTAQANVKAVKSEMNKAAPIEKVKPSEPMFTGKIKTNDPIIKAETKTNITVLNQTKPLDNNEFVNKQVSKAVLINNPSNPEHEQNKILEASKVSPESSSNVLQRDAKKNIPKVSTYVDSKPKSINNNALCTVPFGKWTEANKQEYLNKIRETKVPTSNTSQLKQANDLNRRDVLKKIESQRQSNSIAAANAAKNHEIMLNHNKPSVKNESTVYVSKPVVKVDANTMMKTEVINNPDSTRLTIGPNLTITPVLKPVETSCATSSAPLFGKKEPATAHVAKMEFAAPNTSNIAKREIPLQHTFNLTKKDMSRHVNITKREAASASSTNLTIAPSNVPIIAKQETHIQRATNLSKKDPPYTSANVAKLEIITPPQSNITKKEVLSKKDVIPIGINRTKKETQNPTKRESKPSGSYATKKETEKVDPKKDSTRPTNQDLIDKTVEDYLLMERRPLTMGREAKEAQREKEMADKVSSCKQKGHSSKTKMVSPLDDIEMQMNELHGIPFIERPPHELPHRYSSEVKTYSKNESRPTVVPTSKVNKLPPLTPLSKTQDQKFKGDVDTEEFSEEEIIEHEPITGDIELVNKDLPKNSLPVPVCVTQSLSPKKDNFITENDFDKFVRRNSITYENCITVNYDVNKQLNVVQSVVGKDLSATQQKDLPKSGSMKQLQMLPQHQNKGISNSSRFIPIQPDDGYNANYHSKLQIAYQSALTAKQKNSPVTVLLPRPNNVTSAIDSLVKAAEMLESQSERSNTTIDSQSSQPTPIKRGRGRPRKYPLPDEAMEKTPKAPTPQKKPRVEKKYDTSSEGSSDDEMIRENWTMGKINEDIVCPICNKLFRSENVVFKHVKHCTGPSPNRSDSEKRSREGRSQETDTKYRDESLDSMDLEMESRTTNKSTVSKDISEPTEELQLSPIKSRRISEKRDHVPTKGNETRKSLHKAKATHKINNLVCEFCGKIFRQLSYLVSHKTQHKNDDCSSNKDAAEKESVSNKSTANIFSCEVCKKEFRKLHHLVQHRIIHNPPNVLSKLRRKSSADNSEKVLAIASNTDTSKPVEDPSAGFRCEPCDKSFRKLHHLVEHRETHDGINRQKNTTLVQSGVDKDKVTQPPPQCDVCKKTFRKLHHLIEHKEQHADLNSDKSDDKSVKSALSTKDIIHECSLCYMVFPNEHSLTKHTVICQRKKRQSKQTKPETEDQTSQESTESVEDKTLIDAPSKIDTEEVVSEEPIKIDDCKTKLVTSPKKTDEEVKNDKVVVEKPEKYETSEILNPDAPDSTAKDIELIAETPQATEEINPKAKPEAIKLIESFTKPKPVVIDTIVIEDTPKKEKKTPQRVKLGATVTKRKKTSNLVPLSKIDEKKPSSDEDEIRYMFNPNFKFEEKVDEKTFMKVRGLKRNSLQIERPKSNLITRRISLQNPPRVARLKPKTDQPPLPKVPKTDAAAVPTKLKTDSVSLGKAPKTDSASSSKAPKTDATVLPKKLKTVSASLPKASKTDPSSSNPPRTEATLLPKKSKTEPKAPKSDAVPSTDSDDDVKYSFPTSNHTVAKLEPRVPEKTLRSKALAERRKSLGGIAKRKSVGKAIGRPLKQVSQAKPAIVKKRLPEAGHRCDCGQLFSSAALLSRHTTLAHTPPRIRRRRSPSPQESNKPPNPSKKSSVKAEANVSKPIVSTKARKSVAPQKTPKNANTPNKNSTVSKPTKAKLRRSAAHSGVPVPEKMKKLMEKFKKRGLHS